MIRPARPDDGAPTSARLHRAAASIDAVRDAIDAAIRANRGNRAFCDVLLDIRNALNPPART